LQSKGQIADFSAVSTVFAVMEKTMLRQGSPLKVWGPLLSWPAEPVLMNEPKMAQLPGVEVET